MRTDSLPTIAINLEQEMRPDEPTAWRFRANDLDLWSPEGLIAEEGMASDRFSIEAEMCEFIVVHDR